MATDPGSPLIDYTRAVLEWARAHDLGNGILACHGANLVAHAELIDQATDARTQVSALSSLRSELKEMTRLAASEPAAGDEFDAFLHDIAAD